MSNPTDSLVEKAKAKAATLTRPKLGLIEWGKKYVPHYFTRPFSHAHFTLAAELDRLTLSRAQKVVIIMPRGYAKSTFASFLKALKSICEGTERYILIGSKTEDQASKYLSSIKEELESNLLIQQDYPSACVKGSVWNTSRIETGNDVCVEVFGKGTGVRGRKFKQWRPTLIISDDLQESDDVNSPTMRANDMEWYNRSLIPCGDTDTNYFLIGNNLHQESIVAQCAIKPDYKAIRFAAIESFPINEGLWETWEQKYLSCRNDNEEDKQECLQFYANNKAAMDEGATLLWPEKESLYDLMCMRASIGHAAFDAEKQNNPRDPSKCEFPEEWFDDERFYTELPKDVGRITVGYNDPSKGGKAGKKRDYSPIITLHFYPSLRLCYVEADCRKIPVTQLTDSIIDWHKAVHYDAFGIETNGFQELLGNELSGKMLERNTLFTVIPVENYGVNKNVRISRLSVWLQRGFFRYKRGCPYTKILLKCLLEHPFATYDDPPDAMEGALRVLTMVSNLDTTEEAGDMFDDGLGDNICDMVL